MLLGELRLGREKHEREAALERLIPLVYKELRRVAGHYMRGERPGHTLQATALVHEVFLRLVDQDHTDWRNRAQFVGVAGQLMRRLLVDHARGRKALKRGIAVTMNEEIFQRAGGEDHTDEILAVDEILGRLAQLDAWRHIAGKWQNAAPPVLSQVPGADKSSGWMAFRNACIE